MLIPHNSKHWIYTKYTFWFKISFMRKGSDAFFHIFSRYIWLSEKYYLHTLQPYIYPKQSKSKPLIFSVYINIFLFNKYLLHLNIKWYSFSTSLWHNWSHIFPASTFFHLLISISRGKIPHLSFDNTDWYFQSILTLTYGVTQTLPLNIK